MKLNSLLNMIKVRIGKFQYVYIKSSLIHAQIDKKLKARQVEFRPFSRFSLFKKVESLKHFSVQGRVVA